MPMPCTIISHPHIACTVHRFSWRCGEMLMASRGTTRLKHVFNPLYYINLWRLSAGLDFQKPDSNASPYHVRPQCHKSYPHLQVCFCLLSYANNIFVGNLVRIWSLQIRAVVDTDPFAKIFRGFTLTVLPLRYGPSM